MEVTSNDMNAYLETVEDKRMGDVLKLIELGKKITKKRTQHMGGKYGWIWKSSLSV